MRTREDVFKALARALVIEGFEGSGRNFRMRWPELTWMVRLESIPRTSRAGIYIGVSPDALASAGPPTRANDCPIVFVPESGRAPFGLDHWEVWQTLDTSSDLPDEARTKAVERIVQAIAERARSTTTLADLRQLATDGQVGGAVRRDARALLFGDGDLS